MNAASSPPPRDGEVCRERSPNSEDGYCPCISPAGHLDPHRCLHGSRWICPAAPSEPPVHPILGRPLQSGPCPTCSGPSRETVGMVCQTCGTDYGEPPAADSPTPGNTDPDLGPIDPDVWADFETTCEPPAETQHPYMLADTPAEFERTKRIAAARHQAEIARLAPAEAQQDDEPCCTIDGGGRCNDCPALAARPSADTETVRDALLDVLGAVDELLRQPADGTPRGALAAARDRARRCLDRLSR